MFLNISLYPDWEKNSNSPNTLHSVTFSAKTVGVAFRKFWQIQDLTLLVSFLYQSNSGGHASQQRSV